MITLGLVPVKNFGEVDSENKIYRSAQPLYAYEYNWLKEHVGIENIINLRSELDRDERLAPKFGIKVISGFGIPDHEIPTVEQAQSFMELIKGMKNTLFHCEHGHGRTSLFCVLTRMAFGLSLEEALEEQETVWNYKFKHPKQLNFLTQNFQKQHNFSNQMEKGNPPGVPVGGFYAHWRIGTIPVQLPQLGRL